MAELAGEISREFEGKEIVLVGILKGAFIFMSDLARQMKAPVKVDLSAWPPTAIPAKAPVKSR